MTLSADDIDAIATALAAKLRATPAPAPAPASVPEAKPELIGAADAMRMLRVTTASGLSRALRRLGVRHVSRGTYRRADIVTAIARATLPRKGQPAAAR